MSKAKEFLEKKKAAAEAKKKQQSKNTDELKKIVGPSSGWVSKCILLGSSSPIPSGY